MVTTVNKQMFTKAGITTMPTTLDDYTSDLKKLQSKGVSAHPLDIPFAAAEGLSTYWYETTGALGGTVLDQSGKPQFTSPGLARLQGSRVDDQRDQDRPGSEGQHQRHRQPGHADADGQGRRWPAIFSDYSGNVGTLYNVPSSSSVVNQIEYIPTPGVGGVGRQQEQPGWHRHPQAGEVPEGGREVHPVVHQRAAAG